MNNDVNHVTAVLDEQDKTDALKRSEAEAQRALLHSQVLRGDKEFSVNVTTLEPFEQTILNKATGEADARNAMQQAQEDAEAEQIQNSLLFRDLDHLPPSQRLARIEEVTWPELQRLKAVFVEACDKVEDLNHVTVDDLLSDRISYCFNGQHSKTKVVWIETPSMRNVYLQSGKLSPEGFRPISDTTSASGQARVLFLANDVAKLTDLYDDDESKAFVQEQHNKVLKRAQDKHKRAAKDFAEYKKTVREAIRAVPTFEQLLSKL